MDFAIVQSLLEWGQICRRCCKTKKVQDLEDFSGEMLAVQRLRTHEQLLGLQKGGTFPVNFRNIIEIWETFQDSLESSGILPPFCNPNYHKIKTITDH